MSAENSNQTIRPWWKKKRFLIPAGGVAFLMAISPFVPDDEPVATNDQEIVEDAATTEAPPSTTTTEARPSTTTTEARPSTTTTEAALTNERETFLVTCPDGTETNAFVDAWDSEEAAFDTYCSEVPELETVSVECGGEIIDIPITENDDPDEVCDSLLLIVWIEGINTGFPNLADRTRDADAWDSLEDMARSFCPIAEASLSGEVLALGVLAIWNDQGSAFQSAFGDRNTFVEFAGHSIGAFCPDSLPS